MRSLVLVTLACLAVPSLAGARPLRVRVHAANPAAAILVHEGILSPAQARCSDFVPGRLGSWRVEQVAVYTRHGGLCPGAPQEPPTFLFDVYVDRYSGVVDYTPEGADELQTILPLPHVVQPD